MSSSEYERQILIALWDRRGKRSFTLEEEPLQAKLVDLFRAEAVDAGDAVAHVAQQGLIARAADGWTITRSGNTRAQELGLAHFKRTFEETYELALVSDAFNEYCRRVYGGALAQLNMLDMQEIDELADLLEVGAGDRVLDLGCGAGMITEYLANRTGASWLGIDYSTAAIQRAQARARDLDSVRFAVGDLNSLSLEPQAWTSAIAIDTLYFVDDLTATLRQIFDSLVDGARFITYYTVFKADGQDIRDLAAEATPLARSLDALGISWIAAERTQMQQQIFERSLAAAGDLAREFAAEGNEWLIKSRIDEANDILARHAAGETKRYRYLAHVRS